MNAPHLRELFDYNHWAHRRVWDCIMHLSDDQFDQPLAYSVGSIREQVLHTMNVELRFLHFFQTEEWILFPLERDTLTDRTSIRARWDEIDAAGQAYLREMTDADLVRVMTYQFPDRPPSQNQVWQLLMQVYSHSLDHRAQILAMLHELGAPTVAQDYIRYLGEKQT